MDVGSGNSRESNRRRWEPKKQRSGSVVVPAIARFLGGADSYESSTDRFLPRAESDSCLIFLDIVEGLPDEVA